MKDRTLVQGVKKGFGHKNLMICFKICTNHNFFSHQKSYVDEFEAGRKLKLRIFLSFIHRYEILKNKM